MSRGNKPQSRLPKPFDFSQIKLTQMTRTTVEWLSIMCEKARDRTFHDRKVGRPKNDAIQGLPSPGPMKLCKRCYQPIGKGILHPQPCGIRGRRDNLSESISTDSRTAEILASKLINAKAGSESTIQLASNGPSPITVQIVKKDTCRALFPGITPIPAEQLGHLSITYL